MVGVDGNPYFPMMIVGERECVWNLDTFSHLFFLIVICSPYSLRHNLWGKLVSQKEDEKRDKAEHAPYDSIAFNCFHAWFIKYSLKHMIMDF